MTGIITTAIQVVGGLVLLVLLIGLLRKLFKRPEVTVRDAGELNVVPIGGDPLLGGYAPTAQLGGLAGGRCARRPLPGHRPDGRAAGGGQPVRAAAGRRRRARGHGPGADRRVPAGAHG